MIFTIVRIALLRLWHNKSELVLTFVVPVLFFSIFALIFGSRDRDGATSRIKVAVADQANSEQSSKVREELEKLKTLHFFGPSTRSLTGEELIVECSAEEAEKMVREGTVSTAIVLENEAPKGGAPAVLFAKILADSHDQVANKVVAAMVQKALMMTQPMPQGLTPSIPASLPPTLPKSALPSSTEVAGPLQRTEQQQPGGEAPAGATTPGATTPGALSPGALSPGALSPGALSPEDARFRLSDKMNAPEVAEPSLSMAADSRNPELPLKTPRVDVVDLLGGNKSNPIIAMYAAGIAVMFLLFSVTGAGSSLLEEQESCTLERLLASRMTMDQLLMGKWIYLVILGTVQVTLMFVWGELVFGVELNGHWDGFLIMTIVTAGAASSFALLLATLCKSRAQLNWISIVVILSMSALGGSMVPRYLMSDQIQRLGLLTFNAWALDGYNKVFWRELPVASLWPQLAVLTGCGLLFIVLARLFAFRWERI